DLRDEEIAARVDRGQRASAEVDRLPVVAAEVEIAVAVDRDRHHRVVAVAPPAREPPRLAAGGRAVAVVVDRVAAALAPGADLVVADPEAAPVGPADLAAGGAATDPLGALGAAVAGARLAGHAAGRRLLG